MDLAFLFLNVLRTICHRAVYGFKWFRFDTPRRLYFLKPLLLGRDPSVIPTSNNCFCYKNSSISTKCGLSSCTIHNPFGRVTISHDSQQPYWKGPSQLHQNSLVIFAIRFSYSICLKVLSDTCRHIHSFTFCFWGCLLLCDCKTMPNSNRFIATGGCNSRLVRRLSHT